MNLLSRYIFKQTLFSFLVILGSLTVLVWLTQALKEFDLVTTKGQAFGIFLLVTMLVLPKFISILAPIALFISTIFVLNKLNADNELVVINAAGASRWRTISPFLVLATLVCIGVIVINMVFMPRTNGILRGLVSEIRTDVLNLMLREGRFSTPQPGLTFHVRERTAEGALLGLLVNDERDPDERTTYFAEQGRLIRDGEKNYLQMENGSYQIVSDDISKTRMVTFSQYAFDLSQFEQDSTSIYTQPEERSMEFLFNPDGEDPFYKAQPGMFRSELHNRLYGTIYPFALVMIAIATVGFARTTRQNRGLGIVAAIVIAFAARISGFAFGKMSGYSDIAVFLLYAIPIGMFVAGTLVAFGVVRPGRMPMFARAGQKISEATSSLWDWFQKFIPRAISARMSQDNSGSKAGWS
jgi:lipopolysaccharide export system permease protein